MIVDTPAIDYYRATTNIFDRYYDVVEELKTMVRDKEKSKWRFQQYKGDMYGGIAWGQAMQNGTENYIVDVSGEDADNALPLLLYSDMKPTRIDVQYTARMPVWWDSAEFYFMMEHGVWPGRKREVQARLNAGNDTIYIGDRTSQRYIRIYVKEGNHIRFEVEYKKSRAVEAMRHISNGRRHAMAGMMQAEISSLPVHPFLSGLKGELDRYNKNEIKVKVSRVKTTDLARVKWLASLLPTIEKMTNDHDYGNMVTGWLVDIIERKMRPNDETETV